jgi:MarR family transcriptional regulator, repressor for mepA
MSLSLANTLNRLVFILEKRSDEALQAELGIGYSQFKVLQVLNGQQGILQKDIAEKLHQTEASVSRQVHLLVAKGLIEARINPENRRQREVMLTVPGKQCIIDGIEIIDGAQATVFGSLGYHEQKVLAELAERLLSKAKIDN